MNNKFSQSFINQLNDEKFLISDDFLEKINKATEEEILALGKKLKKNQDRANILWSLGYDKMQILSIYSMETGLVGMVQIEEYVEDIKNLSILELFAREVIYNGLFFNAFIMRYTMDTRLSYKYLAFYLIKYNIEFLDEVEPSLLESHILLLKENGEDERKEIENLLEDIINLLLKKNTEKGKELKDFFLL